MKKLFASCFGLGQLPLAPGTWGSLPPVIIFALFCYSGASAMLLSIVMVVLALVGSIVCVKFAPAVIVETGESDPRQLVADEFAGQALTFITVLAVHPQDAFFAAALAFLFFRIFDILKPWPVYKLEVLPAGWGILADDLAAGIYASVAFNICVVFNIPHLFTTGVHRCL
jgi:phosphatidylglycerophosphatase A